MSRGAGPALSDDTEEILTCSVQEGFVRHARHTSTKYYSKAIKSCKPNDNCHILLPIIIFFMHV